MGRTQEIEQVAGARSLADTGKPECEGRHPVEGEGMGPGASEVHVQKPQWITPSCSFFLNQMTAIIFNSQFDIFF